MTYAEHYKQQGLQQGMQQTQTQMVEEMLKYGADVDFIAKVSHLDKQQIEDIKKSMH